MSYIKDLNLMRHDARSDINKYLDEQKFFDLSGKDVYANIHGEDELVLGLAKEGAKYMVIIDEEDDDGKRIAYPLNILDVYNIFAFADAINNVNEEKVEEADDLNF